MDDEIRACAELGHEWKLEATGITTGLLYPPGCTPAYDQDDWTCQKCHLTHYMDKNTGPPPADYVIPDDAIAWA